LERVADFSIQIFVANKTVTQVFEVKDRDLKDDLYIYEVVCHQVGQTLVTLEIGNSLESNVRVSPNVKCNYLMRIAVVPVLPGNRIWLIILFIISVLSSSTKN